MHLIHLDSVVTLHRHRTIVTIWLYFFNVYVERGILHSHLVKQLPFEHPGMLTFVTSCGVPALVPALQPSSCWDRWRRSPWTRGCISRSLELAQKTHTTKKHPATMIRPFTTYVRTTDTEQSKHQARPSLFSRNWKAEFPEICAQLPGVHCPATAFGCDGDRGETCTICKQ